MRRSHLVCLAVIAVTLVSSGSDTAYAQAKYSALRRVLVGTAKGAGGFARQVALGVATNVATNMVTDLLKPGRGAVDATVVAVKNAAPSNQSTQAQQSPAAPLEQARPVTQYAAYSVAFTEEFNVTDEQTGYVRTARANYSGVMLLSEGQGVMRLFVATDSAYVTQVVDQNVRAYIGEDGAMQVEGSNVNVVSGPRDYVRDRFYLRPVGGPQLAGIAQTANGGMMPVQATFLGFGTMPSS